MSIYSKNIKVLNFGDNCIEDLGPITNTGQN